MLIYLPYLNPALAPASLPPEVLFLDPGLADPADAARGGDSRGFRPEGLPLAGREAKRYVEENLRFGENFARPGDLAYFKAGRMEDFYSDSRMDIASRLNRPAAEAAPAEPPLVREQGLLLLARAYEDRLAEVRELDNDIDRGFEKFSEILGIEDEEGGELGLEPREPAPGRPVAEYEPSWKAVTAAALAFIPVETPIYVDMAEMLAELEEGGAVFDEAEGELIPAEGAYLAARVAGHLLAGYAKPPKEKPWLAAERLVVRPAGAARKAREA